MFLFFGMFLPLPPALFFSKRTEKQGKETLPAVGGVRPAEKPNPHRYRSYRDGILLLLDKYPYTDQDSGE